MSDDTAEGPTTEPAQADTAPIETAPAVRPTRRWRSRLTVALVVLTAISMFASVIGTWAHNTLLDTDRYVRTVTPIADDPRVTEALATELTNQIVSAVDLEALAQRVLPDRANGLALPISSAIEQYLRQVTFDFLQSEQFKTLWVEVNQRAHEAAVRILRDEATRLTTTDGVVTLNLLPLISRVLSTVDQRIPNFLGGPRGIPEITPGTDPATARAELSAALGRDLRDGFGEVVLFRSEQLAAAQKAVAFFDRLVWILWAVTAVLTVAAVALSYRRWRTLAQLGIAAALAAATAGALTRAVQNRVSELILDPDKRAATAAVISRLVVRLDEVSRLLLWTGVAIAIVGYLLGDSQGAQAIRRRVRELAGAGARAGETTATHTGPFVGIPVIRDNLGAFQAGGVIAGVLTLLALDLSLGGLLALAMLVGAYELALVLLSGSGAVVSTEPPTGT